MQDTPRNLPPHETPASPSRTVRERLAAALAARSPTAPQDQVTIRFAYGEWMPTRIVGKNQTATLIAAGGPGSDRAFPISAVYAVE